MSGVDSALGSLHHKTGWQPVVELLVKVHLTTNMYRQHQPVTTQMPVMSIRLLCNDTVCWLSYVTFAVYCQYYAMCSDVDW